jgi:DNA-binding MarR family transcriptional regulator
MISPGRRRLEGAQVEKFHHEMMELIKKYQFRDRNQTSCCGLSVSQSYVLEALHRFGPQSMGDLARRMHLTVSTLTRVVDHLVTKKLVSRQEDANDRRFRSIELTERGVAVFEQSWKSVFASEKAILETFPPSQREPLIRLLRLLNDAVDGWRGLPHSAAGPGLPPSRSAAKGAGRRRDRS